MNPPADRIADPPGQKNQTLVKRSIREFLPPRKAKKKAAPRQGTTAQPASKKRVNPRLRQWRWHILISALLLLSVLVLLLAWLRLFDVVGIDSYVQHQMVSGLDTQLDKQFDVKDISLILVDENTQLTPPSGKAESSHRKYHAELVEALSQAGAKVVVFDMWFDKDSPDDENLAKAITQAEERGTVVLMGLDPRVGESQYTPRALRTLQKNRRRIAYAGGPIGATNIWQVKLAEHAMDGSEWEPRDQPVVPSLILEATQRFTYRDREVNYFYNPVHDQIRVRDNQGQIIESIPVSDALLFLVQMVGSQEEGEVSFYHDVYPELKNPDYLSKFSNKIVFVGYQAGDSFQTPSGKRYGVEVLANAVSNILLHIYIKPPVLVYHYLIIVLMISVGALLPLRFSEWTSYTFPVKLPLVGNLPIPIALLVVTVFYIFIAILAYKFGRTLFNMAYHIAALFLSYFLVGALRSRLGFKWT
ncbi:MAG: CHASE2 domain-containing protein [Pyrinomonadaceae bacterium]